MSEEARERFDRIHKHYDLFNHLFSFGLDIGWRNEAAKEAIIDKDRYSVLDIAAGTGDLSIAVLRKAAEKGKDVNLLGIDFNEAMLGHAEEKASRLNLDNATFRYGDALKTGCQPKSFDVVTSGFALRSFDDLPAFARELSRVMRPGGKFVLLDMARPDRNQAAVKAYFRVIPLIGGIVDKKVYGWLTSSIWKFDKRKMAQILSNEGFRDVKVRDLRSGIAYIITGWKD